MESQLVEQVVPKRKGAKYRLNIFLIIFAAIAIPGTFVALAYITGIAYLIYIALFALMFCIYGVWFFVTSLRVEYEYSFLPSILRIDKVIARRKRRPVVKVDVKILDDFFPYTDAEMSRQRFAKVYHAGASEFSEENHVAVFRSEAKGKCAIVFTPNEQLVKAMKTHFNSELRRKLLLEKRL